MKPIVAILSFTVLLVATATLNQVQGQTLSTLSTAQFADQSTAFSVSYSGEVLRSTDGGQSWSILSQPTNESLLGISMGSLSSGVAVGGTNINFSNGTGCLLTTQDGGSTWGSQSSPNGRVLRAVKMIDSNVGYIVGGNNLNGQDGNGTILKTTDGGQNWQIQTSGTTQALYGVDFIDASNGVAVGGLGTILRTTNGGSAWTSGSAGNGPFYGISYGSSSVVTAVGKSGVIYRSSDAGSTWSSQSSGVAYDLYGADFADANLGVVVGYNGTILRTTNGGSTWTQISNPAGTTTLNGVMFRDASVGTIVGNGGTILRTTDGGLTWSPSSSLPIQLASSAAYVIRNNEVEVTWRTISETNNFGFEIYRMRWQTDGWIRIAFVRGHGTTLTPQSYSCIDRSVPFGKYFYRIRQIDLDGQSKEYPEMEVTVGPGPDGFVVAQNYPNPFNPSTSISYHLPFTAFVTLRVYNTLAQEVATIVSEEQTSSWHTARFEGSKLASGVYFYQILARPADSRESGGFAASNKMLLLK